MHTRRRNSGARSKSLSSAAWFAAPLCLGLLGSPIAEAQTYVPINSAFASDPSTYNVPNNTVLYGVQDITVGREIISVPGTGLNPEGYTITFTGPFVGSSPPTSATYLTLTGSGTAVFAGSVTNYLAGPTNITISGGTLQVGNGGIAQIFYANVVNNSDLVFDETGPTTLAPYTIRGNISGSGTLQVETGTIVLGGALSYTGTTTIAPNSTLELAGLASDSTLTGNFVDNGTLAVTGTTITGNITGTGTLVITGGGTTMFSGTNSASGGTVVESGQLVVISATPLSNVTIGSDAILYVGNQGTSGSISGDITDNGGLYFERSDTVVYGGVVSGNGDLVQLGNGTLILTGNSTYNYSNNPAAMGYTTAVDDGTLQLGNGGTTGSIIGNVALSEGTLAFDRSDTYTFAGDISGPGVISQIGTGTVILTGNLVSDTLTGPFPGNITVASGTLELDNDAAVEITGNIANNGTLIFGSAQQLLITGNISGTGAMVQSGSGTTILDGANTYTGGTTVSGGTLEVGDAQHASATLGGNVVVNNGAMLEGYGTISGTVTNSGGVVRPGDAIGTLTVGSYTQGATGTLAIEVSPGAASRLQVTGAASLGGNLKLTFDPGTYGAAVYPIVDAGSLTGHFASVTATGTPGIGYGIVYTPTAADLVLEPARTGELYGDFLANTFDNAESFNDLILTHLDTEYCNEPSASDPRPGEQACPEVFVWKQILGGADSVDADGSADGYNSRWVGVIVGLEVHSDLGFTIGGSAAYARNSLDVNNGNGTLISNTVMLSLNGGMPVLMGRLDLNGMWMTNFGQATRSLEPEGIAAVATSNPQNTVFSGAAQYSQPLFSEDLIALARAAYASVDMQSYSETAGAPFELSIGSGTTSNFYGDLGLRASHIYHLQSGTMVVPEISGGIRTIFGSTSRDVQTDLGGVPAFVMPGVGADRVAFVGGVGLTGQRQEDFSLFLRADGRISGNERVGVISVGGLLNF